jgi:hypothetical protein
MVRAAWSIGRAERNTFMSGYDELLMLGGFWVNPVRLFAGLTVLGALGLLVRTWLGKPVSPLLWLLCPGGAYAMGVLGRIIAHNGIVTALHAAPPDQVQDVAHSALAIAPIPESLACNLLVMVLVIAAVIAVVSGFVVKADPQDSSAKTNARTALILIAIAQVGLACAAYWRGAKLWAFTELHQGFGNAAPDLMLETAQKAHAKMAAADGLFLIAAAGLLAAVVLLWLAGKKVGQSKAAFIAPSLLVAVIAFGVYGDSGVAQFKLDTSLNRAQAMQTKADEDFAAQEAAEAARLKAEAAAREAAKALAEQGDAGPGSPTKDASP